MQLTACILVLAFVATVSANRCADVASGTVMPAHDCQFYVVCQRGREARARCQPMGTFFDANRMICDKRPRVTCWDGAESSESTEKTITEGSSSKESSSVEDSSDENSNTNRCNGVPSGTILSSRKCQFYVVCQRGLEVQVRCQPLGTFFDITRMVCDKRPSTACEDTTTTTTKTSTTSTPTTTSEAPVTTEKMTTTAVTEVVTTEATTEEIATEASTTSEPVTTAAPPNFAEMCRDVVVDVLPHPTDSTQFVLCIFGQYRVQKCAEGLIFKALVRACAV